MLKVEQEVAQNAQRYRGGEYVFVAAGKKGETLQIYVLQLKFGTDFDKAPQNRYGALVLRFTADTAPSRRR